MERGVSSTPTPTERPLAAPAPAAALVPAFPSGRIRRADEHPVAVYLAGIAPSSRRKMRAALNAIAAAMSGGHSDVELFPWEQLRHQHVQAIRQLLVDSGRAPATIKAHLAAVRGVLRSCWRLGLIDGDSYQKAIDQAPVRGSRLPRGRALAPAELEALFRSCKADLRSTWEWDRHRGARDAAMLALLYGAGLRREEAAALRREDLKIPRRGDDPVGVGVRVRVLGKGNKERLVPLPEGAVRALQTWIECRGGAPGPLLTRIGELRQLTAQSIYMALRRRAAVARVPPFSPHDLRRSYASEGLASGIDLNTMRQLLGHAHVQTTTQYDRRPQEQLARAVANLRVPF